MKLIVFFANERVEIKADTALESLLFPNLGLLKPSPNPVLLLIGLTAPDGIGDARGLIYSGICALVEQGLNGLMASGDHEGRCSVFYVWIKSLRLLPS